MCKVARELGVTLDFDDAEVEKVVAFSEAHSVVAEGSGFIGQTQLSEPSHAFDMARRLSNKRYLFFRYEAQQILELAEHVHPAFGWRAPPLTLEQIQSVLTLESDAARVFEKLATPGKVRIGKVLVIALELAQPIADIAKSLRVLSAFGVEAPPDNETYLGISWQSLSEPEIRAEPQRERERP